jgi:hypothetical protein
MNDVLISFPRALSQTVHEPRYHHLVQLALLATARAWLGRPHAINDCSPSIFEHDV